MQIRILRKKQMKKLIDICDIQYGYAFDSKDFTEDSSYPQLVRIRDVKRGFSETFYMGEYPEEYVLSKGDLLIGMDGEFNIARWKISGALLTQRVCKLAVKEGTNEEYLRFAMSRALKEIEKRTAFVTVKHLSAKALNTLKLDVPDITEQNKVADILKKLELMIFQRKKILQKLDDLIRARFVEMFGTLHNNENGFDVVTIEDVCTLIKDGTHQTPQYTDDKKMGYKFLSSKDVMSQKIDWSDIKYIPAELHEKLYAAIRPQRNDILMSKNGVNYGVAAVNDTDEVFDIYVSLALLRPKKLIDPVFFRCIINNPETKRQFDSSIKGIGVPNLHLGEIKKTKIFLPPMELQKVFVSFVEQVNKSKIEVQKALDETQQLFDSLMQQYFG